MSPSQAQNVISKMVGRIVSGFDPEKVILFGSYARGTATKDSDVDLIVVLPRVEGSRHKKRVEIRVAVHGMGLPKDIVVATPEELEEDKEIPGTIGRIAHLEGKVLYERKH